MPSTQQVTTVVSLVLAQGKAPHLSWVAGVLPQPTPEPRRAHPNMRHSPQGPGWALRTITVPLSLLTPPSKSRPKLSLASTIPVFSPGTSCCGCPKAPDAALLGHQERT